MNKRVTFTLRVVVQPLRFSSLFLSLYTGTFQFQYLACLQATLNETFTLHVGLSPLVRGTWRMP